MEDHILSTQNPDYLAVLDVLLQLRPNFNPESLSAQLQIQQSNGYKVIYVKSESGGVLAVAGFWVSHKLAWGKHIYIDDLVTNSEYRSTGVGRYLINWFKTYATEHGCQEIHLDSNIQRSSAHRFYLKEDFEITSYHFSMSKVARNFTIPETTNTIEENAE